MKTAEEIKEIIFGYQTYCASKGIVHRDSTSDVEEFASQLVSADNVKGEKSESELDLMQYVTNLIYTACDFRIDVTESEFDKWVEEHIELLNEYAQSHPEKDKKIIEKGREELIRFCEETGLGMHFNIKVWVDEYLKNRQVNK